MKIPFKHFLLAREGDKDEGGPDGHLGGRRAPEVLERGNLQAKYS